MFIFSSCAVKLYEMDNIQKEPNELGESIQIEVLEVNPAFSSAQNWSDYIEFNETRFYDSVDSLGAPFVGYPCNADSIINGGTRNGENAGENTCIHAGEIFKVEVKSKVSCNGLSIIDSIDVFDWVCADGGDSIHLTNATFFSRRVKFSKGLKDLIRPAPLEWIPIHVKVKKSGEVIGKSGDKKLWDDSQLEPLPENSNTGVETLSTPSKVYVSTSNRSSRGYQINGDKISIVSLDGSTIQWAGGGANCIFTTGESGAGNDTTCFIAIGTQNYTWIETNLNCYSGASRVTLGIVYYNVKYSRVHQVYITECLSPGLFIQNSRYNLFSSLELVNNGNNSASGVNIYMYTSSKKNVFYHVKSILAEGASMVMIGDYNKVHFFNASSSYVANAYGLQILGRANFVTNLVATNNNYGIGYYTGASHNIVSRALLVGNNDGVHTRWHSTGCNNCTFFQMTAANNNNGFNFRRSAGGSNISNSVIASSVFVNNATGISIPVEAPQNSFYNLAFDLNSTGLNLASSGNAFHGNFMFGNNTTADCTVDGMVVDPGLDSNCEPNGVSSFTAPLSIDLSNTFYYKQSSDSKNLHGDDGVQSYNSITDWFRFENLMRVWAKDGSAFPHSNNRAIGSGATLFRIWDWSIRSTDQQILNRSLNGNLENEPFLENQTCPSAVHGNQAITDSSNIEIYGINGNDNGLCEAGEACLPANTFLLHAYEIVMDDIGNDNGLCESNEACVYSPNIGYDQGSGELVKCNFDDGIPGEGGTTLVIDVEMYGRTN